MTADPDFLAAFDALPFGGYGGTYEGRRPNVWDRDDDSFTRSSIPRTGPRTGQRD